jgi:hypothetical protein
MRNRITDILFGVIGTAMTLCLILLMVNATLTRIGIEFDKSLFIGISMSVVILIVSLIGYAYIYGEER